MAAFQAGWLGHQDKPVLMRPWPWPLGCAWETTKATNALGDVCFFQRKSRLPNPRSPGSQLRPWRSLGGLLLRRPWGLSGLQDRWETGCCRRSQQRGGLAHVKFTNEYEK